LQPTGDRTIENNLLRSLENLTDVFQVIATKAHLHILWETAWISTCAEYKASKASSSCY
jgi:xylose isomerase